VACPQAGMEGHRDLLNFPGMRITTDIRGMYRLAGTDLAISEFTAETVPAVWQRRLRLLRSALHSDHLVIHFNLPDVMFFVAALTLMPFTRCRITTLDFFVGELAPFRMKLTSWCLRRVTRFLVYFRDTAATAARFALPVSRFHYIPFKINGLELIRSAQRSDEGYIFSGGRSRRDFTTFFAAVGELGYPVKMLVGSEPDLVANGSSLQGLPVPPNVEIKREDADLKSFVQCLSAARLVVIPILRSSTTQAGIGVYLQAMAAGKCLIISTGLGISDVITDEQAIIVPAGDVAALRSAIQRAWEDPALRERYGDAAASYALPLGDEDTLRRSILDALPGN
jgi:glycosyltransferase involved in cell wall biosynthesis